MSRKRRYFRCTGLLGIIELLHVHAENLALFIQNLAPKKVTFNPKMISVKCVFTNNFTFINLYNPLFGLKSEKNNGNFAVVVCSAPEN